jgi:NAD(P)-dependent dehydrogenase (short-subunit alcohol dehydrogenase family)
MNSLRPSRILITGGTSGLGYELAGYFVRSGDEVFVTGRDPSRLSAFENKVHFIGMDFADLADVKKKMTLLFNNQECPDIVINNAGVLGSYKFKKTKDGFEYTTQVNFLAHLLIDELILRSKADNKPLTIVSVTSPVYRYYRPDFKIPEEKNYRSFRTYSESKRYLLYLGEYLNGRYPDKNLNSFSFDPWIFRSGISRRKRKWFKSLYRLGAPFMRRPYKVAGRLFEILSNRVHGEGRIYRNIHKYREIDEITKNEGEKFMAECFMKLEKYL